jgi:hypothetical protein
VPKYRFTKTTANRLKKLLQDLGEVEPELKLLKNGRLIYQGQDSEGNENEAGLDPCLRKLADRTATPPQKFDRRSLKPLIEYDSTYKGRELSYLVNLLKTINKLIRTTIEEGPPPFIGPKLARKGVAEFDFPESSKDNDFIKWFEPGTTEEYQPDSSRRNQSNTSNSDRSDQDAIISNLLLRVDYSEQIGACRNIVDTLSPGCGIICTARDDIIQRWMAKRVFNFLEIHNIKLKNAKIYSIDSQGDQFFKANYEYFWQNFRKQSWFKS